MGKEIYRNTIRRSRCRDCVEYLERNWVGSKGPAFLHLLQMLTGVGEELATAYQLFGQSGVGQCLDTSVTVEIALNALGVEAHVQKYGDAQGAAAAPAVQPAGSGDVLPSWAVD